CRPCSKSVLDLRAESESASAESELQPEMWEPPGVEEILESIGSFEGFLEDAAGSAAFRSMKSEIRSLPALPLLTVVQYVMDKLDDDKSYEVMERVAVDEQAAREVMWLYDKRDAVKDLLGWFNGLRRRIEDGVCAVLSNEPSHAFALAGPEPEKPAPILGAMFYAFMPSEDQLGITRASQRAKKMKQELGTSIRPRDPRPYRPGEEALFDIRPGRHGHLYVLRLSDDGEEPPEWVFPNDRERNTSVRAGDTIALKLTARAPVGRHFLKAVVTREPLIDTAGLDFRNRFEAQDALERFLTALARLPGEQKEGAQLQFIVSTQA
ncbi:MAG: hypothetical protein V2B18_00100, partial [Pseudomonadota bacterium]